MTNSLVVGSTGQDGALICKKLLSMGKGVVGTSRRQSSEAFWRLSELGIENEMEICFYEVGNGSALEEAIDKYRPDQIFLPIGDSSTVSSRDKMPTVINTNLLGAVEQYDSIKKSSFEGSVTFFGSSEVFGYSTKPGAFANEDTHFAPSNVYGLSKSLASEFLSFMLDKESSRFQIYEAILFPHESEFRGGEFVVQKIVKNLVQFKISDGDPGKFKYGDLSSTRDWGSAKTYADWLVTLASSDAESGKYVFGTGSYRSVRDVFSFVASTLDIEFETILEDGQEFIREVKTGKLIATALARTLVNQGHGYVGDSTKLLSSVSLSEPQTLEKTLAEMVSQELRRKGFPRRRHYVSK